MSQSFFEGPEKKVELVVRKGFRSLRSFGSGPWRGVVEKARAAVLSRISNERCDAWLLSESRLFVFDNRAVMITCGRTTLVEAVGAMLEFIPLDAIGLLIYERKNENFPERQPTTFGEDVRFLERFMPGRIVIFGEERGHHISLFHLEKNYEPEADDMTLEILMHGIGKDSRSLFCTGSRRSIDAIHDRTGIGRILPGFAVDDFLFEPQGYSLNAVRGGEYYAIHVTPQEKSSYVSFETNHLFRSDLDEVTDRVLRIFRPKACDILFFQPEGEVPLSGAAPTDFGAAPTGAPASLRNYTLEKNDTLRLECGFRVRYSHCKRVYSKPALRRAGR